MLYDIDSMMYLFCNAKLEWNSLERKQEFVILTKQPLGMNKKVKPFLNFANIFENGY